MVMNIQGVIQLAVLAVVLAICFYCVSLFIQGTILTLIGVLLVLIFLAALLKVFGFWP
jgi:hypothetical protein